MTRQALSTDPYGQLWICPATTSEDHNIDFNSLLLLLLLYSYETTTLL